MAHRRRLAAVHLALLAALLSRAGLAADARPPS
jgi:hypothetical protein